MMSLKEAIQQQYPQAVDIGPLVPEPPQCATCGDLGVVRYDVPIEDVNFGKFRPCPNPACPTVAANLRRRQELLLKKSHWTDSYSAYTFESWYEYVESRDVWAGKAGAYCAATMFAECGGQPFTLADAASAQGQVWPNLQSDGPRSSLLLSGDVGMGKTGLAVSAANLLRDNGKMVLFLRAAELIDEVQDCYRRGKDSEYSGPTADDVKQVMRTAPLLIVDEFNLKNYTRDRLEILEDVMRARDKAGLPFMATTNLSLDQFYQQWEKQIADVVAKAHWVRMGGHKLRDTSVTEVESF